ncbi:hypothetical protein G9A89_019825 [Geosiphon pyriformis]|nr:hypothetical protein G9A89_019825 [Geosiphon pyriformis]
MSANIQITEATPLLSEEHVSERVVSSRLGFCLSKLGRPFIVGHRGSSDSYPENTILAFEQAIADGAHAIEFDIQKTLDDEVIILHDPDLDRTTTGYGPVAQANYHDNIKHVTTKQTPHCLLPRFEDVIDMLLKEQNQHVWGVIDVKPTNPLNIFELLARILRSRNPDLQVFSKRIMLGIWHPKFLPSARKYLTEIPIVNIGTSIYIARAYFSDVDGYNLLALTLAGHDGKRFLQEAHEANKPVFVWTVNSEGYAKDCHRWGVDAIMTDKPKFFLEYFASENFSISDSWFFTFPRHLFYLFGTWLASFKAKQDLHLYGKLEIQ